MPQSDNHKIKRRQRHAALATVVGLACIRALASPLNLARTFVVGRSGFSSPSSLHETRLASPRSSGISWCRSRGLPHVAMRADAMFEIFDVGKVLSDPGSPVLIAQCIAAASLVLLGKYFLQKEEEEEHEKEKEHEEARAKMVPGESELKEAAEEDYDIWRDSLLRYLGYSNELGEAVRPIFPAAYFGSYVAAFSYVFADSFDKFGRADKKSRNASARKAFIRFDTNCDGVLGKEEVRAAFDQLKTPLSPEKFDAYFAKLASTDTNNQIKVGEFMAAFERRDQELIDLVELFQSKEKSDDGGILGNAGLVAGADALIWQVIASVALPGFTINRFVTLAELGSEGMASPFAEYFPTVFGLSMIPIVCKPLDVLADVGLDATLRPILFAQLDLDKSGTIDYKGLSSKLEKLDDRFDEKYLRKLFDELDVDKDGAISIEDWSSGGYGKYKAAIERA